MILGPVASFSQSFSPFELTATHFGPNTVIFGRPKLQTSVIRDLKSWFLGLARIASRELYIANTWIWSKDPDYMWQIQLSLYWKRKNDFPSLVLLGALPQGLFFEQKTEVLYFWYIESSFLCLKYIEHVLSKLCAPGCAPAGPFFPAKIHFLYFIDREPLFLCLRYIQTQLWARAHGPWILIFIFGTKSGRSLKTQAVDGCCLSALVQDK